MANKSPDSPQLPFLFRPAAEAVETAAVRSSLGSASVTVSGSLGGAVGRAAERRTWQVHELIKEARVLVESELGDIWVEGEISNFRPAASGHHYFTLKDEVAQLQVVMFRRQAGLLRFRPEDGLHVRIRGKASVYEQRGQLQLIAELMEPVGAGSLQLAFEQLKERLRLEGLFEQGRKRPLPSFPRTVAIITSPTGAVIRDFLNIVNRRHSGLHVLLLPTAVQGEQAAAEIAAAIGRCGKLADLVVLARGGGSLEDLAAFNSEVVARAIAASQLPVVSAVGHESDFTIADFVADLRAPTPSAAAELITEAQHRIDECVAALSNRLVRAGRFRLLEARQSLARLPVTETHQKTMAGLHRREQRVDDLCSRLEAAIHLRLRRRELRVAELEAIATRHDPRRQLAHSRQLLADLEARLRHGLDRHMAEQQNRTEWLRSRLERWVPNSLAARRARVKGVQAALSALSPLAVLDRGYAVVLDGSGGVVRSAEELSSEQVVTTRLADGRFTSRVISITLEEPVRPADAS